VHNLQADILEEFAEAQRKGDKRKLRFQYRSEQGWQIRRGMQGACSICGLPIGQHAQWGCRPPVETQEAYKTARCPGDPIPPTGECVFCKAPTYRRWIHVGRPMCEAARRYRDDKYANRGMSPKKAAERYGITITVAKAPPTSP